MDYLCYYIPTHGTHIYSLLCILCTYIYIYIVRFLNDTYTILIQYSVYVLVTCQVWFQNARAKYRRSLLKQQHSEIEKGVTTSPSITDIKDDCGDNGCENMGDDCNTRSPALSDISSSPSLSDINSNAVDSGDDQSLSSIADIFSSTVDTLH